MSGILAVLEHREGKLHPLSIEAIAAAQQLAVELGQDAYAVVAGSQIDALASEVAVYNLAKVHALEHDLLAHYTADGYTLALKQLIAQHQPGYVVFAHTYQARDFAPGLAASLERVLVSDVVAHRVENGALTLIRQLFQGKMNADVTFSGPAPFFLSIQAGAFRAENASKGASVAPVEAFTPSLDSGQIRSKPQERFRESQRAIDLSTAERIVSAGRGIREAENIALIEQLAHAMGAELAASRPICDNGWLPMERQVGSSGQTVAPKLYVAVGISGAIQHLVGMKGSRTIVAINKDPEAPIFEIADYGIVGDLFEVVPALIEALKK